MTRVRLRRSPAAGADFVWCDRMGPVLVYLSSSEPLGDGRMGVFGEREGTGDGDSDGSCPVYGVAVIWRGREERVGMRSANASLYGMADTRIPHYEQ